MSESTFLPIQTKFGILCSRTDFWLNNFVFDVNGNSLEININFSMVKKNEDGSDFRISEPFLIRFNNVKSFNLIQYDDFEGKFSNVSGSNFDQSNSDSSGLNIYLLWTYDHCFEVHAKGYSFK
ncbi:hypothetical protein [Acinetobacter sp. ESBL14]|uniref:hypothetical protein n=1 Tax=Acinetobacter sp. ESBL14 TaxID=3077329 RepID=UPI002FC5B280